MKNFTCSLIGAVIIHIIVLVVSGLIIGDKQTTFFEYQNTIPVQMGSRSSKVAGNLSEPKNVIAPAIAPRLRNKIESISTSSLSSPAMVHENAGPGTATGNGTEASFESTIISYQKPVYPRLAQVRGLEGNIQIRIRVSPLGLASETAVLKSSGHEMLDKAALEAVSHWRFQKNVVSYDVEKTIVFKLKN